MQIKHLSLTHFRIFDRLEIEFTPGTTILVGANAQGKTSLLEAIYYLTAANGVHATHDRELINFQTLEDQTPFARVVAGIESQGREQTIEIRISLKDRAAHARKRLNKEVLINGVKRRVSGLSSVFNAVLFLPRDIDIDEGSPGSRRDFLDNSISQAEPAYAAALGEYRKVITQRNALLKLLRERRGNLQQLEFWDQRLCEHGSLLMAERGRTLSELTETASEIHTKLSRGNELLELRYLPRIESTGFGSAGSSAGGNAHRQFSQSELQVELANRLPETRKHEIQRGLSVLGPHRDDFQFCVNDIDLSKYGSRGQNRTALLSLKLAEIQWLKERTGEWPVLLLDEVLAELDVDRRSDLLQALHDAPQSLLTSADPEMFLEQFLLSATILKVEMGTVVPFDAVDL